MARGAVLGAVYGAGTGMSVRRLTTVLQSIQQNIALSCYLLSWTSSKTPFNVFFVFPSLCALTELYTRVSMDSGLG